MINVFKKTSQNDSFLKNIQSNIYSYNLKELIESCTTFEFEFTSKKISDIFNNAIQKERKNRAALKRSTVNYEKSIKDILEKIGLIYDFNQNEIRVSDKSKWGKFLWFTVLLIKCHPQRILWSFTTAI